MPRADVDGQPVYYEDTEADGAAVLFCHGFLMDHTMFDPQVELLGSEFRCLRMDERGFGRTPAEEPFTYWDLADDAVGVLDDAGVERAAVVGMSQGGFLALRAALGYPDRVTSLVLIDTQPGREDEEAQAGYRQMFETWMSHGPRDELLGEIAGLILGHAEELRTEWMEKWKEMDPEDLVHPVECLLGRDDVTDRLAEISHPALIIHGADDQAIPIGVAEEMERSLPGSSGLVRVPGAAHAPNLTHPEIVNPPLLEFLRRNT